MSGLHDAFDDIVADVPVYGDLERAIEQVDREQRRRHALFAGLAAAAAVVAVVLGLNEITGGANDSQEPIVTPITPTPTQGTAPDAIPLERSGLFTARQVGDTGLEVAGEKIPGRWTLGDSVGDVWIAMNIGEDDYESQWWGKGTTTHAMPPSMGRVLRGGVVISPDGHWIVWTRPSADVYGKNPPRVMEVVDTASGEVRWSRKADADAVETGALAVTNDGVVVFAHCLKPILDSGGWLQCEDARVDVWSPTAGITRTVPAGSVVGTGAPAGYLNGFSLLVETTGAHNGLLVQETTGSRPQYLRVSERGAVEVVATLPRNTLAVTADERFALVGDGCDGDKCRWNVVPLEGGEPRSMVPTPELERFLYEGMVTYVPERDDLLLVSTGTDLSPPVVARCSLAQARCVAIKP